MYRIVLLCCVVLCYDSTSHNITTHHVDEGFIPSFHFIPINRSFTPEHSRKHSPENSSEHSPNISKDSDRNILLLLLQQILSTAERSLRKTFFLSKQRKSSSCFHLILFHLSKPFNYFALSTINCAMGTRRTVRIVLLYSSVILTFLCNLFIILNSFLHTLKYFYGIENIIMLCVKKKNSIQFSFFLLMSHSKNRKNFVAELCQKYTETGRCFII